jgi:hypothetical protein
VRQLETSGGQDLQLTNIRWKRWLAGLVGLLAAYTLAGFWLLPLALKSQIPKYVQTELARQATVGAISFNPFTLRLQAQDLSLTEADGAALFSIGKLDLQLQWQSLTRRVWSFAEIRIAEPSANLTIAADGKFNVAELLATFKRQSQQSASDAGLVRLSIARFTLERGKLVLQDRQAHYDDSFSTIGFELGNFSTLPDQTGTYAISAESKHGGKLRWKGEASVYPMRGSGELTLENVALPELTAYLKSYTPAAVASGQFSAILPYRFSYADGKFDLSLAQARADVRDLALTRPGEREAFAKLSHFEVSQISADLARREVTLGAVRGGGGQLALRRNARGDLDLTKLLVSAPALTPGTRAVAGKSNWKLNVGALDLDHLAISAVDETVSPPLKLSADQLRLHLQLSAAQAGSAFKLALSDATLSLANLALASGANTPLRLAQLGFSDGTVDLAARRVSVGRLYAKGGQMQLARERDGRLDILRRLPNFGASRSAPAKSGAPWKLLARRVELSKFGAELVDQGTGIKMQVQDFALKLDGASSDLAQPIQFNGGLSLRAGGQLSAQGSLVPQTGALKADVSLRQLALAPLQPLLGQYLKLKIASGSMSAQGRLTSDEGGKRSAGLRYAGALAIENLKLNEEDGELFAQWKSLSAAKLSASLNPNSLVIAELRLIDPVATLIIENDRSFNAARLQVQPASAGLSAKPATPAVASKDPFAVRIQRLRVQNAKLDFTDLSLRPQFSAKVYELNGLVNGMSSAQDSRSQIELDGRVDEFGLARVRGELNPFSPRDNTNVNVVFKNINMVAVSPYAIKFAGYRVAEGKISLDLRYTVRRSQLEGANQIVIDKLLLGERVDSPDAFKLPLELAIAILKDSDGRIDLGLPVTGNMDDPQFSYGVVVWKALGNLLSKIVTAPFRALGNLFGVSGDKLESIEFDPGSDRLLPPEHEKLKQVAQMLSKRAQLTLSVPGQYSEAADGAALKRRAVRSEIVKRAGIELAPTEAPGPLDIGDRKLRVAVRELYAERFGAVELDKEKKAAEAVASESAAPEGTNEAAPEKLSLWQRAGKMVQGEPQVADARAFYRKLEQRLVQQQPLAPDALTALGAQRASIIVLTLKEDGVDPQRMIAAAPEAITASVGKPVPLKLGLAAK